MYLTIPTQALQEIVDRLGGLPWVTANPIIEKLLPLAKEGDEQYKLNLQALREMEAALRGAQLKSDEMQKEIQELSSTISSMTETVERNKAEYKEARAIAHTLNGRVARLATENEELRADNERLRSEIMGRKVDLIKIEPISTPEAPEVSAPEQIDPALLAGFETRKDRK